MVLLHFTYIIFFALFGFSLPRWNTLTRTYILRFVSSIRGKWHLLSRFLCALKIIRHKKTNNCIGTNKQKIRKLFPAFPLLKMKGKNEILTPHKKRFLSIWILFDFFALFCWFFFLFHLPQCHIYGRKTGLYVCEPVRAANEWFQWEKLRNRKLKTVIVTNL